MHVARQRCVRLAAVPEVAIAALAEGAVIQVVARKQHGADPVHEAAHGLGPQTTWIHRAPDVEGYDGFSHPRPIAPTVNLD